MLERTGFSSFLIASLDELRVASDRPRLWLVSPPVLRQLGPDGVIEMARAHDVPEIGVQADPAFQARGVLWVVNLVLRRIKLR